MSIIYTIWNNKTFEYGGQTIREATVRLKEHIHNKDWLQNDIFCIKTMEVPERFLNDVENDTIFFGEPVKNKMLVCKNPRPFRASIVQAIINEITTETHKISNGKVIEVVKSGTIQTILVKAALTVAVSTASDGVAYVAINRKEIAQKTKTKVQTVKSRLQRRRQNVIPNSI